MSETNLGIKVVTVVGVVCLAAIAVDTLVKAVVIAAPYVATGGAVYGGYRLAKYVSEKSPIMCRNTRPPDYFPKPPKPHVSHYPPA